VKISKVLNYYNRKIVILKAAKLQSDGSRWLHCTPLTIRILYYINDVDRLIAILNYTHT